MKTQRDGRGLKTRSIQAAGALLILGVATALRLYGIAGEPVWHDESCTVSESEGGIPHILRTAGNDTLPPLYYLGLYPWRKLAPYSPAHIRAYSALWSLIGLAALFLLARDTMGARAAWVALLLGAVNPLDIRFAQEARMYSQANALLLFSSWALWRWLAASREDDRFKGYWHWAALYTVCVTAAVYTHSVTLAIPVAQGLFALAWWLRHKRFRRAIVYGICALATAAAFAPWLWFTFHLRGSFYNEDNLGWIPPPMGNDFFSFMTRYYFWGHVYAGYEQLWFVAAWMPVFVLGVCAWRFRRRRLAPTEEATRLWLDGMAYLAWVFMVPVILATVVSFAYHPVYYPSRFSLFVLGPFLVLCGEACGGFASRAARFIPLSVLAAAMLAGTIAQELTTQNAPEWKAFARFAATHKKPAATVFFPSHGAVAASYHLNWPVSSAPRQQIEGHLGELTGKRIWVCLDRDYDFDGGEREDAYFQWLMNVGDARDIRISAVRCLFVVKVCGCERRPLARCGLKERLLPWDVEGRIHGFDHSDCFHRVETMTAGNVFRRSRPKAWLRFDEAAPGETILLSARFPPACGSRDYRPKLSLFTQRGPSRDALFDGPPSQTIAGAPYRRVRIAVAAPAGEGPLWLGWTVNPPDVSDPDPFASAPEYGLMVYWVAFKQPGPG